jgi:hypothetical protein
MSVMFTTVSYHVIIKPQRNTAGECLNTLYQLHKLFNVGKAYIMKMGVFWYVAPYILVSNDRRFREAYCRHHEGG